VEEIKKVLSEFAKSKIPCPNRWPVDFFTVFFDLVGRNLLGMVEESKTQGKVIGALNATFLALIPKSSQPSSYEDFRPISCCDS